MKIKRFATPAALADYTAHQLLSLVQQKPDAVVCLATGESPAATYARVAELAGDSFRRMNLIALDEWVGVPRENPGSCYHFLQHNVVNSWKLDPSRVHLFDGLSSDFSSVCDRMNQTIQSLGGIELMIVGVGLNGHIGFNEPGADENGYAHLAKLDELTSTVGQKYFPEAIKLSHGLTLGLRHVREARQVLMLAQGAKKAPVIQQAVRGEISNRFPASLLRRLDQTSLFIDQDAASQLTDAEIAQFS